MKKIIYTLLAVTFVFSACKKEDEVVTTTVINGCTDATATNYNSSASNDDGSCNYSIVGTWTPTDVLNEYSYTVTVMGAVVEEDAGTETMTSEDEGWEFTDVEFTDDGQMISEGESNSYSHSDNVLTITDDEGTETNSCTVTSTSLTVIISNTEEEEIDYMGQVGTLTSTQNMTLNCTRQ